MTKDTNTVIAPIFDAMEYAQDYWAETLNYMNDDEIVQIYDYDDTGKSVFIGILNIFSSCSYCTNNFIF
jgi:hypothetical protein